MKNLTFILILAVLPLIVVSQDVVKLPTPAKTGGKALMDCLNERHSCRDYTEEDLTDQQLSNLLWAAAGINRPESGKRTAPNSRNKQEIDIYLAKADGVYKYDHLKHSLIKISSEDKRAITGEQDFVATAAVNLIYVADYERIESSSEKYKTTSGINVGLIVQNVYLYCASEGLGSVVRGWFKPEPVHEMLGLGEGQEVILTQTVGVPAKAD